MEVNELSKNSKGGTELMLARLHGSIEPALLDKFQIIPSRVRELSPDKVRIFWAHDLPGDPEATAALANGKHDRFHKIVFVSNWQMQRYIDAYELPWSKCVVLQNAIEPIQADWELRDQTNSVIQIVYHTTPHRGLNILLPVFEKLASEDKSLWLDVFSSFEIYGWKERDEEYKDLFNFCDNHPQIIYHGAKSNEEVRRILSTCDIFAYPSIWPETSCLALIEAMSAGLICVHPNYGALYETAGPFTFMYQMQEDNQQHAAYLYTNMKSAIEVIRSGNARQVQETTKNYADGFFDWKLRAKQWTSLLNSLLVMNLDLAIPAEKFTYRR